MHQQKAAGLNQESAIILDCIIAQRAIGTIQPQYLLEFFTIGILHRTKCAEVSKLE